MRTALALLTLAALAAPACQNTQSAQSGAAAVDVGLEPGYSAALVVGGLNNPSCVTFSPKGVLTVCDSGNGRVVLVEDGKARDHITGFATEYWKVDAKTGAKRFKLGPLSCVWLGTHKLAVTDGGRPDGEEAVLFFSGPGTAADGKATNTVGPTTDEPADKGEGNLTGMVRGPGGRSLYLCGQGSDAKSWLLRCDVTAKRLVTFGSADVEGLAVNSPMQAVMGPKGTVLVLYSGAGGKPDGTIGQWDRKTGALLATWTLPGLVDPMGMTTVPGSDELVVVDNNWALKEVKQDGRIARVTLPKGGGKAAVTIVGKSLRGPVSCAFGPDGRLYVAELGKEFDKGVGRVIAVSGF
jgi:hypothetical protein